MVTKKSSDSEIIAYIFGIISIVIAFFAPLAGLIFGVIGFVQSKKQKTDLSKKAKKLNIIGIVLNIVFFIITLILTFYLTFQEISSLANFPIV
jgi:heme/copper-type cytochrome/quinol oxidase subunit 2